MRWGQNHTPFFLLKKNYSLRLFSTKFILKFQFMAENCGVSVWETTRETFFLQTAQSQNSHIRYEGDIYIGKEIKGFLLYSMLINERTGLCYLTIGSRNFLWTKSKTSGIFFPISPLMHVYACLLNESKSFYTRRDKLTMEEIQQFCKRTIQIQSLSLWHIWHCSAIREGSFFPLKRFYIKYLFTWNKK